MCVSRVNNRRLFASKGERTCSHIVLFCTNPRDCTLYLRFHRNSAGYVRSETTSGLTVTAESSKNDEEWNTRVCNFVTAHGKRVFPYIPCANCIILRELYVHARGREMRVYAAPRFSIVCITFPAAPSVYREIAWYGKSKA